ncbi:hypothetical protein [Trinickia sp.]|uniref:hypothetical protein n=1 Tax=Trinickia sp. TaxID=2571163 RepID=UPI003F7DAA41
MDAHVREIGLRLEAFTARAEEREQRFIERLDERDKRIDERLNERDKRIDERLNERDKRLDERDKRIELLAQRADVAAESAANLKAHLWMAASTVVLAVAGTVIAAYYATQSSHFDLAQTIISAFQQRQQTPLKE